MGAKATKRLYSGLMRRMNRLSSAVCAMLLFGSGVLLSRPVILQGPVVDGITYSSARITWITDQPARTRIRYGLRKIDSDTIDIRLDRQHSWFLSGLAPSTTYRYKVCSEANGEETCSDEQTVTTVAAPAVTRPARAAPRAGRCFSAVGVLRPCIRDRCEMLEPTRCFKQCGSAARPVAL